MPPAAGATVVTTVSRGKHLLTRLDDGHTVHSHLRMEGAWLVHPRGSRWRRPAHTARLVLQTEPLEAVGFAIVLDLLATADEHEYVGHLGPDLLGPDWDPDEAVRRIATGPDVPVADALLDQRNLAGVGNVYKSELCFLIGATPWLPVGALPPDRAAQLPALAKRLLEANRERPVRSTTGRRGQDLFVYGRAPRPCLRCRTPIRSADQGDGSRQRPTYWCPSCQTGPAPAPGRRRRTPN